MSHLMIKPIVYSLLFLLLLPFLATAQSFSFDTKAEGLTILYSQQEPKLDSISAQLLADDIEQVIGKRPKISSNLAGVKGNVIVVGNITSDLMQQFIPKQSLLY